MILGIYNYNIQLCGYIKRTVVTYLHPKPQVIDDLFTYLLIVTVTSLIKKYKSKIFS